MTERERWDAAIPPRPPLPPVPGAAGSDPTPPGAPLPPPPPLPPAPPLPPVASRVEPSAGDQQQPSPSQEQQQPPQRPAEPNAARKIGLPPGISAPRTDQAAFSRDPIPVLKPEFGITGGTIPVAPGSRNPGTIGASPLPTSPAAAPPAAAPDAPAVPVAPAAPGVTPPGADVLSSAPAVPGAAPALPAMPASFDSASAAPASSAPASFAPPPPSASDLPTPPPIVPAGASAANSEASSQVPPASVPTAAPSLSSPAGAAAAPVTPPTPATSGSGAEQRPSAHPLASATPARGVPSASASSIELELPDGQVVPLVTGILLGRDPQPQSHLDITARARLYDTQRSVSKTHAAVGLDSSGLWVIDLESTNGTSLISSSGAERFVDPGVKTPIADDDSLRFGEYPVHIRRR